MRAPLLAVLTMLALSTTGCAKFGPIASVLATRALSRGLTSDPNFASQSATYCQGGTGGGTSCYAITSIGPNTTSGVAPPLVEPNVSPALYPY